MVDKNPELLDQQDDIETQDNKSPDVSDNTKVDKIKDKDQAQQETELRLTELQKRIQQMKASKEYDTQELDELEKDILAAKWDKKKLEKKAKELDKLAKQKEEKEDNPSLLRRFWYGSVLGATMEKIWWTSGKEWADKKLHEKKDSKKKGGFWSKVGDAFLFAGAFFLGKKIFDKTQKLVVDAFGKKDEETVDANPDTKQDTADNAVDNTTPDQPNNTVDNNVADVITDPVAESPLQAGEQQQITSALVEEDKLRADGVNELYILSRLLGMGFVPSNLYRWRPANFLTNSPWNFKVAIASLVPSMKDRLIREKAYLISKWVGSYDYDMHIKKLNALEQDLKTWKINSFEDIQKRYPDLLSSKPSRIDKLLNDKKSVLKKVNKEITQTKETLETHETKIRKIDTDMKSLQKEMATKYEALKDLDKAAVKDPVKKKELRAKLQELTTGFQKKQAELYKNTWQHLQGLSNGEIVKLQRYDMVNHLVKQNGGAVKFLEKVNTKGGRIMMRVGLAGLVYRGFSEGLDEASAKSLALDAADLWAGLVPIAGGIYDFGMAIYGKDLNGRQMSTADRWIRWSVGVGTTVLDLFSFGVAGTAVRASVKATTKVVKIVNKTVDAEKMMTKWLKVSNGIYKWTKVVTHGAMFTGLTYGIAINVYDMVVSSDSPGQFAVEKIQEANTAPSRSIK